MHWWAQCHAKWPTRGRAFMHSSRIEPKSQNSLRLTLTTKALVRIIYSKNSVYDSSYFATFNRFFCVQDCRSRIVQVEYQGQTRNSRILERKPLINASLHLIAFNIDWSWNIFFSHNFCSMLIEQLIDLERLKSDNLKIRTDIWDRVMDCWSVTQ